MILLEEIAEEIIRPILPKDSVLSIKAMNTGEKSICLDAHNEQEDYGIISDINTIKHRHINLVINWTDDYSETESVANMIYKKISKIEDIQYNDFFVKFIVMDDISPVDNKRNKEEIFSKIIDFEIFYEKEEF